MARSKNEEATAMPHDFVGDVARVLVTGDEDNEASARIILRHGGTLEDVVDDPDSNKRSIGIGSADDSPDPIRIFTRRNAAPLAIRHEARSGRGHGVVSTHSILLRAVSD